MEKDLKHSVNFLKNKVGKKTGFKVPLNYFDDLENSINTINPQKKLEKHNVFLTPENYFNTLENKIIGKITLKNKETKSIYNKIYKLIPYAAAACILLFIGLNSFIFNTTDTFSLNNISDNDIEYWLDLNTFNTSDITDILQDEILDENDFALITINDKVIEDYIYTNNNVDVLNIIEQY